MFKVGDEVVYSGPDEVNPGTPWRDKKPYPVVRTSLNGRSIDILVKNQVRRSLVASLFSLVISVEANE